MLFHETKIIIMKKKSIIYIYNGYPLELIIAFCNNPMISRLPVHEAFYREEKDGLLN